MKSIIDPHWGDFEDDRSSTKRRSLLAIAGILLAEISLPRVALAWISLVGMPALLLGLAPLVVSAGFATASRAMATAVAEISSAALVVFMIALGLLGGRPLFRLMERSFWTLNSLTVQPTYALCREALRHVGMLGSARALWGQVATGAVTAAAAGLLIGALALGLILVAWPASRWIGQATDLTSPHRLILPALANGVLIVSAYFAAASVVWGWADATMQQPRDLKEFDTSTEDRPSWRIAHLSDLHFVGERFGWRIESGRSGPRGNSRMARAFAQLEALHGQTPVDIVLISGDITDAGRSAEWAEFLDMLSGHPQLAHRVLIVPGNHDINIVDRGNPARLELPTSPSKRLRQLRAISAIAALQGERVRVIDHTARRLGGTLADALAPRLDAIVRFADTGTFRLSTQLHNLWDDIFPMILPPDSETGLGVILLNSNAETHFSFTNALGMVSAVQVRGIDIAVSHYPQARWLVVLHHHLVEYPNRAVAFSERIGTAVINGSWFTRRLQRLADRAIVMHGHRHIDWIGECGGLAIVSAPSPVMGATDDVATCFHVQTVTIGADGRLMLRASQRVDISGDFRGRADLADA